MSAKARNLKISIQVEFENELIQDFTEEYELYFSKKFKGKFIESLQALELNENSSLNKLIAEFVSNL